MQQVSFVLGSLCQTADDRALALTRVIPPQQAWAAQRAALGALGLSNMVRVFRELSSLNQLVPVVPDFGSTQTSKPDLPLDKEGLSAYAKVTLFAWRLANLSSRQEFFCARVGTPRAWLLHELLLARTYFLGCHLDLAETGAEDFLWSNQIPETVKAIEDFLHQTGSVVRELLASLSFSAEETGAITQNLLASIERQHEDDAQEEEEEEEGTEGAKPRPDNKEVAATLPSTPEAAFVVDLFSLALASSAGFQKELVGKATSSMTLCSIIGELVKGLLFSPAHSELLVKSLLVDHSCKPPFFCLFFFF